jgi:hypothetical protein
METREKSPGSRKVFEDPPSIESVVPKLALGGISGVGSAAINATGRMGTADTIGRGGDWGVRLRGSLAARCEGAVGFFTMRAHTDRADDARGIALVLGVTPEAAALAEWHAYVDACWSKHTSHAANIHRAAHEGLHPRTRLRVPDVEENSAGVRRLRVAYDPRWGS